MVGVPFDPNATSQRFDAWMRKVDAKVDALAGLSVHDLADQPFFDWFDADMSPATAARKALKAEGWR